MADNENNNNVREEIQKILININDDMNKLKLELSSLNSLVEENATLPVTAKMVNEKLMIAAKKIGIDLENIMELQDSNEDESQSEENSNSDQSDNEAPVNAKSDVASVAAATKNLTRKVKSTLK